MSEQKIDGFELKPGFKGMASDTEIGRAHV